MRPSAGTPYLARMPETLVSPQAQDRGRATGIASPLRTPEPKADAANHATRAAAARAQIHPLATGLPGCRAPSTRPEPALLAAAAAVLPDQARAADCPSSKPNPGRGGHSRDRRSHRPKNSRRRRLHAHETHHHHYHRRFPAPYPADAGRRSAGDAALEPDQHDARTD